MLPFKCLCRLLWRTGCQFKHAATVTAFIISVRHYVFCRLMDDRNTISGMWRSVKPFKLRRWRYTNRLATTDVKVSIQNMINIGNLLFIQQYARGVISDLRREVDVKSALLDYCAGCSGKSPPTFRDNLSFPSSRVKNPDVFLTLEDGNAAALTAQKSAFHITFAEEDWNHA